MLGPSSWPLRTTQAPQVVKIWVADLKSVWFLSPSLAGEACSDHQIQLESQQTTHSQKSQRHWNMFKDTMQSGHPFRFSPVT